MFAVVVSVRGVRAPHPKRRWPRWWCNTTGAENESQTKGYVMTRVEWDGEHRLPMSSEAGDEAKGALDALRVKLTGEEYLPRHRAEVSA